VNAERGTRNAVCGTFKTAGGAELESEFVRVRYAVQADGPYCDALAEEVPKGQGVVPVWLIVNVPSDQEPGLYSGQMTVRAGEQEIEVPVEVQVCAWALPDPKDYISHVSLLHSPDTLSRRYGVKPWSERHFELIEESLSLMGQVGNDVVYIPVVRYTHLGNNSGMIRWAGGADGDAKVELGVLERFLDLYEKHCGPPKVLCLDVWSRRIRRGESPAISQLDTRTGKVEEMAAPPYGAEGSDIFWRPMMDGVRHAVRQRGWDERCVMIGVATDWWPRRQTVTFFKSIAPYARWAIFTHGRERNLRRSDRPGVVTVGPGMEIGYHESPFFLDDKMAWLPWERGFLKATSMRGYVTTAAHPLFYRLATDLACTPETLGIARIGLDYWTEDGYTLIGAYERWNKLFRNSPRTLTVPGLAGPLPTVRYQVFKEGLQETEARLYIAQALYRDSLRPALAAALRARLHSVLERRLKGRELAAAHVEQASAQWYRQTMDVYAAAGELQASVGGGQK